MSNQTDPWETEMSREFDQRVRDLHEAPLNLDRVKGKAGRIRRNRRLAVAGGVLAAAAVIVPIVVFAGGNLTNDSGPEPAPKPTPDPTVIDPSGTGFGYLEGKTLHRRTARTPRPAPSATGRSSARRDLFAGPKRRRDRPAVPRCRRTRPAMPTETHETAPGRSPTTTTPWSPTSTRTATCGRTRHRRIASTTACDRTREARPRSLCGQEDLDCAVWRQPRRTATTRRSGNLGSSH